MTFDYRRQTFEKKHGPTLSDPASADALTVPLIPTGDSPKYGTHSISHSHELADMVEHHCTAQQECLTEAAYKVLLYPAAQVSQRRTVIRNPVPYTHITLSIDSENLERFREPLDHVAVNNHWLAVQLATHPERVKEITNKLTQEQRPTYIVGGRQVYVLNSSYQDQERQHNEYILTDGRAVVRLVLPNELLAPLRK